ncbi:Pc12g13820 [Penicillium rubens Wisconsin 54-1255]|uniref:Pc12g13820 protein n=1 Tax=Penicillium rubens (strain ATCC 28089 / DSM 1075 / NRRL 1951 / Wisconsin 54-1255) TaxID=500485 RepID=B6H0A1_PENRW|nr:Pc12g13820 [Penicillium rubens Wisconsin 54-1255]
MESTVSIHHGPYESIPATASPGLKFLRRFLPALDSLTPAETPISPFFTPSAPILIGSDPPTSASQAVPLLEVRSRHICKFHHHVYLAWDIDLGSDTGPVHTSYNRTAPDQEAAQRGQLYAPLAGNIQMKRTVMFEATSETTFKEDPDQFAVRVQTCSGPFGKPVYGVGVFWILVAGMRLMDVHCFSTAECSNHPPRPHLDCVFHVLSS